MEGGAYKFGDSITALAVMEMGLLYLTFHLGN
jgi:hypothetical protein